MDDRSPVEKKGWHGHSLNERVPQPLPGQAFIAFLCTLHEDGPHLLCFALGDYLLQITKERMLLITTKKRMFANTRGKVVELVTLHT